MPFIYVSIMTTNSFSSLHFLISFLFPFRIHFASPFFR